MAQVQFIGLDLGRSAVKAIARQGDKTYSVIFPSAVTQAHNVVYEQLQASAASDTVELGDKLYWTGNTALVQHMGGEPVGRSDDWVNGTDHDVLVKSAIDRLQAAGMEFEPATAYITLGVPSRVYKTRRDLVDILVTNTKQVLGKTAHVYVQAQPMGVITRHSLTPTGFQIDGRDMDHEAYCVIEVGQYTTDFGAVVKNQPIVEATASIEGVELISNYVRAHLRKQDLILGAIDLQTLITNPKMRMRGQVMDLTTVVRQAIDTMLMPKLIEGIRATFTPLLLQTADAILIAGGGAPIIIDGVKAIPELAHAVALENPREAVADGFARISALMYQTQAQGTNNE